MKILASIFVVTLTLLLTGQSHAQSSWGTQDTSIAWVGFDWRDLGVGGYNTNTNGFGEVGQALDLGNLDPTLAGLTVTIRVDRTDAAVNSSWSSSNGTTLSTAALGGIELDFVFSAPVAFRRTPLSSVAFGLGEIETYTSDSLDFISQSGALNLVDGLSIDAIPPAGFGSVDITAEDYNTTHFSVTWDDNTGAALTQALHFEIGLAVPEPTSGFVLAPFMAGFFLRRRRKN